MCKKVYIDSKLNEEISDGVREQLIEIAPKIEGMIKEGNKNKIMQLDNSKVLYRVHLKGRHLRAIISYKNGEFKIYSVFEESDEKKKIKYYDKICKNENKFNNFINITPQKNKISQTKINELKEILKALESSALMGIPKKGKFDFEMLLIKIEKQKWIRKYDKLKDLFRKLRHDNKGDLKLIKILRDIKKRDSEEKLINKLSELSASALNKEIDARLSKKKIPKISEQLTRRVKWVMN